MARQAAVEAEAGLADILKSATRAQHDQIEHNPRFARLMAPDLALREYRALLEHLYGFYRPLEEVLEQLLARTSLALDYTERRKAPLLTRDLLAVGRTRPAIDRLPRFVELPNFPTPVSAVGALYVVEGATLGGQIIYRHLNEALGLDDQRGAAFFRSYGADVGPMWRRVRRAIDALDLGPADTTAVVDTANATFQTLNYWMLKSFD